VQFVLEAGEEGLFILVGFDGFYGGEEDVACEELEVGECVGGFSLLLLLIVVVGLFLGVGARREENALQMGGVDGDVAGRGVDECQAADVLSWYGGRRGEGFVCVFIVGGGGDDPDEESGGRAVAIGEKRVDLGQARLVFYLGVEMETDGGLDVLQW
jgi:hypothetical protein